MPDVPKWSHSIRPDPSEKIHGPNMDSEPVVQHATSPRYCALSELIAYVTGWALLGACFRVNHDIAWQTNLALLGLFALPGILIIGGIGYAVGGRKFFLPAALFGSSLWIFLNLIPLVN